MEQKPNVILITSDQQRYDSVGINGCSFIKTPNLDRIGREGVSFSRAYCPNSVCTPSRVSIMTGQHLSRHGAYNIGTFALDYSSFMSELLHENGYYTHHIGKAHWYPWGSYNEETKHVDQTGSPFTDFAGFQTAEISIGHGASGITSHYAAWMRSKGYNPEDFLGADKIDLFFDKDENQTGDWKLPMELHQGSWLAERAVTFLKNHNQEQPFYLNLGFQDPHHPHILPYNYSNPIDPSVIPLPNTDLEDEYNLPEHIPFFHKGGIVQSRFNGKFTIAGNDNSAWEPYFKDEHKARMTRAYYYSMIQMMDEQLGIIVNELDDLGMAHNTIIIFTSDHGEMLGDHSIGQKGPLAYEGVTHIPFLMRYPDGFNPQKLDECVSLVDIMPTILDFTGIDDEVKRDGISLKRMLQKGQTLSRKGVRIEYKEEPDRIRYKCWVTTEWKLVVYLGETFGELYDLRDDPGEKNNLFDDPACLSIKYELLNELLNDMERSEPVSIRPSRV